MMHNYFMLGRVELHMIFSSALEDASDILRLSTGIVTTYTVENLRISEPSLGVLKIQTLRYSPYYKI